MREIDNLALAEVARVEALKGYSYGVMDCQAFVEHCFKVGGMPIKNYRGSNDMLRNMVLEVKPIDGDISAGDIVFMVNYRGGEPARYKKGGAGYVAKFEAWDASHVGIYIGDGLTAESAKSLKLTKVMPLIVRPWTHYARAKGVVYGGVENLKAEIMEYIRQAEEKLEELKKEAARVKEYKTKSYGLNKPEERLKGASRATEKEAAKL